MDGASSRLCRMSSIRDLVSDLLPAKSRPESPKPRPVKNGANTGKSPQSPKSPAPPQYLRSVDDEACVHWLIIQEPIRAERFFSPAISRAELARYYPRAIFAAI